VLLLLITLFGGLVYFFAKPDKLATLGMLVFAAAVFWAVHELSRGAPPGLHW
jgi:uncharacterized membrane protein (UPF0136 family)